MTSTNSIPDPPSDTIFSVSSSVIINAPASFVFEIFTTPSTWATWNSFNPGLEITQPGPGSDSGHENGLAPGTKIAIQVRMNPESPKSLQTHKMSVTDFSKPERGDVAGASFRVSWTAEGYPRFSLRTGRTSECVVMKSDEGEDICEFRTWENMAGPLARIIKYKFAANLQIGFDDTTRDIKLYAEKQLASGNHA